MISNIRKFNDGGNITMKRIKEKSKNNESKWNKKAK